MTPPKHIADLLRAGQMLSNGAYNLAQSEKDVPNARHRKTLHESRLAWDAALSALREAEQVAPKPAPTEAPRALRALASWCRRQAKSCRKEALEGWKLAYEHAAGEAEARARKAVRR